MADTKLKTLDIRDHHVSGVECSFSDRRELIPIRSTPLDSDTSEDWLKYEFEGDEWLDWPLRILSIRAIHVPGCMPFDRAVVNAVNPPSGSDFTTLWRTESGGSSALIGAPIKFVAQTPRDGKDFCSMSLTTTTFGRGLVRGIYFCTSGVFECSEILRTARLYSGWRSSGWQIMVLPIAFLSAHVTQKAVEISHLSGEISKVENAVMQPHEPNDDENLDFGVLSRKLHECQSELLRLERRSHFEAGLIKNIEMLVENAKKNRASTEIVESPLHLAKTMMETQDYDLKLIPKRIESQRTMIFNLIVQRDARLNLQIGRTNMEIADTSRRIAEASMRDSASMKTIALLTMIFLPGTAVASFFSMTMFQWEAGSNKSLVSSYIWIYFVVSVPLTLIVVGVWYFALHVRRRRVRRYGVQPIALSSFPLSDLQAQAEDTTEPDETKGTISG